MQGLTRKIPGEDSDACGDHCCSLCGPVFPSTMCREVNMPKDLRAQRPCFAPACDHWRLIFCSHGLAPLYKTLDSAWGTKPLGRVVLRFLAAGSSGSSSSSSASSMSAAAAAAAVAAVSASFSCAASGVELEAL